MQDGDFLALPKRGGQENASASLIQGWDFLIRDSFSVAPINGYPLTWFLVYTSFGRELRSKKSKTRGTASPETVKDLRALILTNQLEVYAGSEIVAMEVAETLLELGIQTDIYAGYINEPIDKDLVSLRVGFGLIEDCPDPFSYDFIWSQHQILPHLLSTHYSASKCWPFIVSVSLSPFEPHEMPGAIAEASDVIIANSKETCERLTSLGIARNKIKIFHNAAPNRFAITRHHRPTLNNVAIISNHTPEEIFGAANMLSELGVHVDHIGLPNDQKRVTPEVLSRYDAVITIGKTVQYCILSETPVFVYDKFGGPGWLTESNHQHADAFNFSGRCTKTTKTKEEIFQEIQNGYPASISSIQTIKQKHGEKYNLKTYIKELVDAATSNEGDKSIAPELAKLIMREGIVSGLVIQFYRKLQAQSKDMESQNREHTALLMNAADKEQKLNQHISELREQTSELTDVIKQKDIILSSYQSMLKNNADEIASLRSAYKLLTSSNSWKLTRPLRVARRALNQDMNTTNQIASTARKFVTRLKNAVRYLSRGDLKGLIERLQFYRRDYSFNKSVRKIGTTNGSTWAIVSTPHTLFIAQSIAIHLEKHNIKAEIITTVPAQFNHDFYIVLCAQMFDRLPPNERRILFQLEQSVSSRWFSDKYISDLENSFAVLDYSLTNIEFLKTKGIQFPHIHYLPIGLPSSEIHIPDASEKEYDFLFYGDSNSSERRRIFLSKLQEKFKVKIYNNLFGDDMHSAIRKAKIVVNIHYYEGALLETPRIQECISLGVPVLSEGTRDQDEYPELSGAVHFFKEDSVEDMLAQAEAMLGDIESFPQRLRQSAAKSSLRFSFMLDRALVAMGLLQVDKLSMNSPYLPEDNNVVTLSLPETILRRRALTQTLPQNVAIFDGARYRPGWIGCGLSFKLLAMYALAKDYDYLTVFEDDAQLPDQYEKKISEILEYLTARPGEWDVFSGMMAEVHPDTRILSVDVHNGTTYATVNRMVSTVYNIYNRSALSLLSKWDPTNHDVEKNPIDRYLQNADDLRVVVALPFFAGHSEEMDSTLWGFQNERYTPMIAKAEEQLRELADQWLKDNAN